MSAVKLSNTVVVPPDVTKLRLKAGRNKEYDVVVPPSSLTIREIQQQIPAVYFESSTLRSLSYLARDILQGLVTYMVMYTIVLPFLVLLEDIIKTPVDINYERTFFSSTTLSTIMIMTLWVFKAFVWSVFWFLQGLNGTALWVLAHECGHRSFSPLRSVNDTIGMALHSALLVPYHSWRITHGTHHKHTNHLTKDLVFVPKTRSRVEEMVEEAPVVTLLNFVVMFLFGWPGHLLFNASGQNFGRNASHFDPSAPFFRSEDYRDVILSDIGVICALFIIGASVFHFGFTNVFCWYIVPYLWVNFWLVYITFLQHSDIRLPHYTHEHWTFVRGALAAVDRDYGALLNAWLHHINDSHVVHHLFSRMPHYNAIQVTRKYIKDILGDTYVTDSRPLWKSLWHTAMECRYVVPDDGVCVYRK